MPPVGIVLETDDIVVQLLMCHDCVLIGTIRWSVAKLA
jgi:hypothetical protein